MARLRLDDDDVLRWVRTEWLETGLSRGNGLGSDPRKALRDQVFELLDPSTKSGFLETNESLTELTGPFAFSWAGATSGRVERALVTEQSRVSNSLSLSLSLSPSLSLSVSLSRGRARLPDSRVSKIPKASPRVVSSRWGDSLIAGGGDGAADGRGGVPRSEGRLAALRQRRHRLRILRLGV